MSDLTFTIGEIAALANVTPKTIRHYHQIGLLPEPPRTLNHYRRYTLDHLDTLRRIVQLKSVGLSLANIKTVLGAAGTQEDALRQVLRDQERALRQHIEALRGQLEAVQTYLATDQPPTPPKPSGSALHALTDSTRRQASGLADLLGEMEAEALAQMDSFVWSDGYEAFWAQVGRSIAARFLGKDGSPLVFWLERYVRLRDLPEGDLQAAAWLDDIAHSPARRLLAEAFDFSPQPVLPDIEQGRIRRLLPLLLMRHASPLQQRFWAVLLGNDEA